MATSHLRLFVRFAAQNRRGAYLSKLLPNNKHSWPCWEGMAQKEGNNAPFKLGEVCSGILTTKKVLEHRDQWLHDCWDHTSFNFKQRRQLSHILFKHVDSIFPSTIKLYSFFYSNHHSPPLLFGFNSLSSFICKGPLLSSLRKALIQSVMLNKEGKLER